MSLQDAWDQEDRPPPNGHLDGDAAGSSYDPKREADAELFRLAAIVESSDDAMIGLTLDGTIRDWNPGAERLYGYSAAEVRGRSVSIVVPPERASEVRGNLDAARRGEHIAPYETQRVRKNGERIDVSLSVSPIQDRAGHPIGASWIARDITAHKAAEEALRAAHEKLEHEVRERTAELREANARLRKEIAQRQRAEEDVLGRNREFEAIFRALPDLYFRLDRDGTILDYKAGQSSDPYLPPGDFLGRNVQTVLPPAAAQEFAEALAQVDRARALVTVEYSLPVGGELRSFEARLLPVGDDQIVAIVRNVTGQKLAQAENEKLLRKLVAVNEQLVLTTGRVREEAERAQRRATELEATIHSIVDAVFLCDQQGWIVDANAAALRLIGIARKEDLALSIAGYLGRLSPRYPNGEPIAPEDLAISHALRGQVVGGFEQVVRDLSSEQDVYLLVSSAPVRGGTGQVVGAVEVLSDITRLKELDKLKDEFISVAAHELKTPVAIMKGYAQFLLRSGEKLPPTHRKMLSAIERGANRIDGIVRDLLDVSQLHFGALRLTAERIDLPALVADTIGRLARTTKWHHLRLVRAESVTVQGDRERLAQVLENLIENAIRYSPRGGDVDVAVEARPDQAVVSVTDRGVGIPRERQAGIFGRFYRAHANTPHDYGGMGVGLYISREIVARHGGAMWFESEEGKGSTFYFSLPRGQSPPSSP